MGVWGQEVTKTTNNVYLCVYLTTLSVYHTGAYIVFGANKP